MRTKGFTIIEVLVVSAVVALISVAGAVMYTTSNKNAQDQRRKSDISFLQNALEHYYSNFSTYPITLSALVTQNIITKEPYMDPKTNTEYSYVPQPAGCDAAATPCTDYTLQTTFLGSSSTYTVNKYGTVSLAALPTVTTSPLPTNTPIPTATPSPSPTSTPTPTPTPTVTPTPTITPTQAPPPLTINSNHRFLQDSSNNPVFFMGDSAWSAIAQLSTADMDYYLNDRSSKGFTAVIVSLIEHKFADHAPNTIDNISPFTGANFTTPNPAYFTRADYFISQAAAKNIYVFLDPLYLGYGCGNEGWCAEVQAASTADLQSWGTYLGNRYQSYNNIIWVIGGDTDPTPVKAKVDAFAQALKTADTRHLMTAHNGRGTMAVTPWTGSTWLTVNDTYTDYLNVPVQALTAWQYSPATPFFQIESYYENEHSMTAQQLRAEAYWTYFSGGFGYMFGNCPMWGLGSTTMTSFCDSPTTDWKSKLNSTGSLDMQRLKTLLTSKAWQKLVPDISQFTFQTGTTRGSANYIAGAKAAAGNFAFAYVPVGSSTFTAALSTFSSTTVTASWWDPTNGATTAIAGSPFNKATYPSKSFTSPTTNSAGAGDFVLVLTSP